MSVPISISVDITEAAQYVDDTKELLISLLQSRVNAVDKMFADRVRDNLSGGVLKTQTGKLLGTVQEIPAGQAGSVIEGSVVAGGDEAPYGIYFEMGGERWYDIIPVFAKVLAFEMNGTTIFARHVNHPPVPYLPWFGVVVPEIEPIAKENFEQIIHEVLAAWDK